MGLITPSVKGCKPTDHYVFSSATQKKIPSTGSAITKILTIQWTGGVGTPLLYFLAHTYRSPYAICSPLTNAIIPGIAVQKNSRDNTPATVRPK